MISRDLQPVTVQRQYIPGSAGPIHILQVQPVNVRNGVVLLSPPFAEEMNKSRRMLRLQAESLARVGYEVVLPDLFGTGDSYGDFQEASWASWKSDLASAVIAAGIRATELAGIIGVRLGALLALDALRQGSIAARRLVFWNPATNGKTHIDKFLRLRSMASLIGATDSRESVNDLRSTLRLHGELEVAGYKLNAALVKEIDALNLVALAAKSEAAIHWYEVSPLEPAKLSFGSKNAIDKLCEQGADVRAEAIQGAGFWTTTETTIVPQLIESTSQVFVNE